MSKTVLASLLSVVGLAAAAQAQVTIEIRIVDDSDLVNRPAGLPSYALPGPAATSVGLTLQARVTTGTVSNFGISGVDSVNSSTLNAIGHQDAVSNGWTGAISRGPINGTGAEGGSMFGAFNPFRQFIGSTITSTNSANWNAANGNAPAGQNRFPGNAQTTSGANVAASLPGTRTANGFQNQDSNNRTQITALFLSTATTYADNGSGAPVPVNGYVPTEVPAGVASPWANLYRFFFNPRPNNGTDVTRNQAITFTGRINYGSAFAFNDASQSWLLTSTAGRTITAAAPVLATLLVPSPGAAALLGLGGLAAFRRRRAQP